MNPFKDVASDAWYYGDVAYVFQNGLMFGTATDLFSPDAPLTRGMVVTILYRHAGEENVANLANPFSDVAADTWYADAVKWAAENGIVTGVGGGLFAPNANITRQDMAAILARYLEYMDLSIPVTQEYVLFADEAAISDYAKNAIQLLHKLGIINGVGNNTIDPKGTATRAQAAAMLHRFIVATEEYKPLADLIPYHPVTGGSVLPVAARRNFK